MRRVFAPELLYVDGAFHQHRAVVCEGGRVSEIVAAASVPAAIHLSGRAMLPGLVNAHSHSFQRVFRGATEERRDRRDDFWSWREAMFRAAGSLSPRDLYRVARMAFLEMALAGITTVGEFHYIHNDLDGKPYDDPNQIALEMVRAARSVGIRICLLRTAYARGGFKQELHSGQRRFVEPSADQFLRNVEALRASLDGEFAWAGVAPHSVRAVPLDYLREVSHWARREKAPIHMHVSEQPRELDECIAEYGVTPGLLLAREGILTPRFTAVHGIYLTPDEIRLAAEAKITVCACPTTERNLGDGILGAVDMKVAFGTDSQAQIDLLEDARQLEYHLRLKTLERGLIAPLDLFKAATGGGAASLQVPDDAADFFTIDLRDPSIAGTPIEAVVFTASKGAIQDLIVGGEFVVRDGKHALTEEIVDEFLKCRY